MSNLLKHAEHELSLLGKDEMQAAMNSHLLAMVRTFAEEGHSGGSAAYAIAVLTKLLNYEPLTPLTGDPSEWSEVTPGLLQNKRCSRVFKRDDGKAYDIEGRIFREPDGSCFQSGRSSVYVDFPYIPKTEYVDLVEK